MSYRHNYQQVALDEYKETVAQYKKRNELAAENFVKEMDEAIKAICSDPTRYRNTYKNFRETSLKKFPYAVVYLVDEAKEMITISSVYHHRRNPETKYEK